MKNMRDTHVTIFGAGVAGLTCAHELINRGFRVTVIESAPNDDFNPSQNDATAVGGMARTQWGVVDGVFCDENRSCPPRPGQISPFIPLTTPPTVTTADGRQVPGIASTRAPLYFDNDTVPIADPTADQPDTKAAALFDAIAKTMSANPGLHVWVLVNEVLVNGPLTQSALAADLSLVDKVKSWMKARGVTDDRMDVNLGMSTDGTTSVQFVINQAAVPGEHGFRFFPSFYRHLFDTMQRTPQAYDNGAGIQYNAGLTVYDNLVHSDVAGVGLNAPAHSFVFPRARERSLEQMRVALRRVLVEMQYSLQDIARMEVKLFTYLTSCKARREAEYEGVSWSDFLEKSRFTPAVQRQLENAPQIFVALQSSLSDARTQGNVTMQLMLDQLTDGEHSDSTLNGPTSTAWFSYWRTYLKDQGVSFCRGTLVDFQWSDDLKVAWPVVDYQDGNPQRTLKSSCCVLALPLDKARKLVPKFMAVANPGTDNDFVQLTRLLPDGWEAKLQTAQPDLPLQHLSGIQFFFESELQFARGHTVYMDAPWGLSSIAQPQFWARARASYDGYRGLLSVDIGNWYTPGKSGRMAWESTADEIAWDVWQQVKDAYATFTGDSTQRLPEPLFYHLDRNIKFGRDGGNGRMLPSENCSPFMVNRTGEFKLRPGTPGAYQFQYGWVLAGAYLQTFTRMTTMESANESARHAVNAVLDHVGFEGGRCQLWDPEIYELDDLKILKDLDRRLLSRGAAHFVEVLGLDRIPEQLFPIGAPANLDESEEDLGL